MTKIKLDLDALLADGLITAAESQRLQTLALPNVRNSAIINVMLIFGAIAIATAAIALIPDPTTGLVLAVSSIAGAEALRRFAKDVSLNLLSSALAMMGTLGIAGWVAYEFQDAPITIVALAVTFILLAGAVWFRSAFLGALTVLSLGGALGAGTAYWHASYGLFIREPTITIIVFGAITAALFFLHHHIGAAWEKLALVAGRTAFFLANFGFWVGSLFGDYMGELWKDNVDWQATSDWRETAFYIPEIAFTIGWAGALIAIIAFARRGGFLSITSIVFLTIHGYTQYFETFEANPLTILIAGIVLVVGAVVGAKIISKQRDTTQANKA